MRLTVFTKFISKAILQCESVEASREWKQCCDERNY